MLRDITIGQYFPGNSVIHRLDPRFKIVITIIFIIMLFTGKSMLCLAIGAVYTLLAVVLSKIKPKMFWKSVKPLLPFLVLTAVINLLLISSGNVLWEWRFIKITDESLNISVFMIARIVLLIIGSSILTYTTSPITLTDAIERLLSPLKKLKFPVSVGENSTKTMAVMTISDDEGSVLYEADLPAESFYEGELVSLKPGIPLEEGKEYTVSFEIDTAERDSTFRLLAAPASEGFQNALIGGEEADCHLDMNIYQ